jgi:hypothetical protein
MPLIKKIYTDFIPYKSSSFLQLIRVNSFNLWLTIFGHKWFKINIRNQGIKNLNHIALFLIFNRKSLRLS